MVARTEDPMDCAACEKIARYMCQAFDQGIGIAVWMMNRQQHMQASAIGQMTLAIEVGDILRNTKADDAVGKLNDYFAAKGTPFCPIVEFGVITDISIVSQGGFDTGVTTVRADSGETYKAARRMWDKGSPLRRQRQTSAGTICRNAIAVGMR